MAIRYTMGSPARFISEFEGIPEKLEKQSSEALKEVIKEGDDEVRKIIGTSGTGWKGHTGRIETGKMQTSTSAQMINPLTGRFGWPNAEKYYQYQEEGFKHRNGRVTPPMHALVGGFLLAKSSLQKRLTRIVRGK